MNFYDKINLLISRKVRKKKINMLVTGGQTAKGLYKYWQKNNYFLNKKSINFFLSDERIVPTNQKYSNYNSLKKNLFFNNGSIKYKFFTFFEDKTKMTKQIKKYEKKLPKHFDIAILSSGNDGHVASIFSNKKNYLNTRKKITFSYSAKKPRKRVTLSLKFIKKTKIIIIMFKGTKRGEIAAETKINPKNRKFVISNFIKNYWIFDKKAHTAYTKKLLNQN